MKKRQPIKRTAKLLIIASITFCLLLGGFLTYTSQYYPAGSHAQSCLAGDSQSEVIKDKTQLLFIPKGSIKTDTGLIFYPGAKVESAAYAPLLKSISNAGYFCALVEMPFNLAFFDINAADRIIAAHPEIENWYLAGHSLGGAMAASYFGKNSSNFKGLILLASYSTADLSESGLKVLSLYGSEDKVLNMEKRMDCKANLPEDAEDILITGGNHAGFADYGHQKDDGTALISQEKQHELTANAMTAFMQP